MSPIRRSAAWVPSLHPSRRGAPHAGRGPLLQVGTLLVASCVWLAGCGGAQAKASAEVNADADASVDFDAEGTRASRNVGPASTNFAATADTAAPGTPGGPALLGARHDLRIKDPGAALACQCLAVVVGSPSSPAFAWSGEVPTIDPSSQIVIALESDGVPCSAKNAPIASYRGYSSERGDTVIEVEAAQEGRPTTRGAIVPKPSSGSVRIRAPKALPFSKATSGSEDCIIKLSQ